MSVGFDGWTTTMSTVSGLSTGFIGVSCHYLTLEQLPSCNAILGKIPMTLVHNTRSLAVQPLLRPHTSERVADAVSAALSQYSVSKTSVVSCTTDNNKTEVAAVTACFGEERSIGVRCLAHSFNLCAGDLESKDLSVRCPGVSCNPSLVWLLHASQLPGVYFSVLLFL